MRRTAFQAALNHLLKLNIFRCYASSPNLIFCDTHVVLLKLTELVQHGFELRKGTICGLDTEDLDFINEGVISIDYLSVTLSSVYFRYVYQRMFPKNPY